MTTIRLRDATETDRAAIYALTLSAYQEYASVMQGHWAEYRNSIIDSLAEVQSAEQIVAEYEATIVGTVLLFPAGTARPNVDGVSVVFPWPEIRLLAVAPARRGHGVGAALVRECMRRAQQSGAGALMLHTTSMMQPAKRMYERLQRRAVPLSPCGKPCQPAQRPIGVQ